MMDLRVMAGCDIMMGTSSACGVMGVAILGCDGDRHADDDVI
jgi:hypothetical protein